MHARAMRFRAALMVGLNPCRSGRGLAVTLVESLPGQGQEGELVQEGGVVVIHAVADDGLPLREQEREQDVGDVGLLAIGSGQDRASVGKATGPPG